MKTKQGETDKTDTISTYVSAKTMLFALRVFLHIWKWLAHRDRFPLWNRMSLTCYFIPASPKVCSFHLVENFAFWFYFWTWNTEHWRSYTHTHTHTHTHTNGCNSEWGLLYKGKREWLLLWGWGRWESCCGEEEVGSRQAGGRCWDRQWYGVDGMMRQRHKERH